jgi:hypothetical protein
MILIEMGRSQPYRKHNGKIVAHYVISLIGQAARKIVPGSGNPNIHIDFIYRQSKLSIGPKKKTSIHLTYLNK